jgi:hypothetical protein
MRLEHALGRRVSIYQFFVEEFDGGEDHVSEAWKRSWLPVLWRTGPYVLDTEVPDGAPSPLWI